MVCLLLVPGWGSPTSAGRARPRRGGFAGHPAARPAERFPVDGEVFNPRRGAPFSGSGGMLVGPDGAGIDTEGPFDVPDRIVFGEDVVEDAFPDAVGGPAAQSFVRGFPRPYRSGRSRHGAPVRSFHRIALITCR